MNDLSSISKEGFSYVQNNNSLQRSVDVEMKDYNYLLQKVNKIWKTK